MASKTGSFLRTSDRQRILRDLKAQGGLELASESIQNEAAEATEKLDTNEQENPIDYEPYGTGCLSCGRDDDHANLLLCETCNAEYHTYCLEPPLRAVPTGHWYCPECKAGIPHFDEDGLDALVDALSPCFTSRFGEVCWAQGGVGFGWWPAFIYDPRLTVGNARQLAKKNLGKRHLVYFFECHDAPFSVLPTTKITKWEDGLTEDFHLGKTARSAGQKRSKSFRQALQAATLESHKPIEMRMDWNHSDQPQILPSPQPKKVPSPKKRQRRQVSPVRRPSLEKATRSKPKKRSKPRGFPLLPSTHETAQTATKRNLSLALESLVSSASKRIINSIVEPIEDGPLYVKLLQKTTLPMEDSEGQALPSPDTTSNLHTISPFRNVGFVKLSSLKSSTFADARVAMQEDLGEELSAFHKWRFFVPGLGPVSLKQESKLGPIYSFLRRTTTDRNLGEGTLLRPIKVFLVEMASSQEETTTPRPNSATTATDSTNKQPEQNTTSDQIIN